MFLILQGRLLELLRLRILKGLIVHVMYVALCLSQILQKDKIKSVGTCFPPKIFHCARCTVASLVIVYPKNLSMCRGPSRFKYAEERT